MKRLIAVLLALSMTFYVAPLNAIAATNDSFSQTITVNSQPDADLVQAIASDPFLTQANPASQEQNATVDTSNVSMEATNSFGKLLLNGMDEENGSNFSSDNRIISVKLNGKTATVKYLVEEDADLVVGIYADDAEEQMVASGTVTVTKTTDGTATVAITGDIPEYYVIKGYLFDKAEHAPLCNPFVNTFNTKDMVDLSTATVDDFPEDRVINLDDDATTNFAVVKQDVTLLTTEDSAEGKNNITNEDNDGLNYTIENASEEIKNLQVGDILTYEYAPGELLVVKVSSIQTSGDAVTISGDDSLEITDVFEAVKIEGDADNDELSYDDSTADEGVTYLGEVDKDFSFVGEESGLSNENGYTFDAGTIFDKKPKEVTGKASKEFEIFYKHKGYIEDGYNPDEGTTADATITGKINFCATAKLGFFVAANRKYVSFAVNGAVIGEIEASGYIETRLRLGSFGFAPVVGCYIAFEPTYVTRAEAKLTASIKISVTIGAAYDSTGGGVQNLCEAPNVVLSASVEGTLYVGVDMVPKVHLIGSVVNLSLSVEFGGEGVFNPIDWSKKLGEDLMPETKHGCLICYSVDIRVLLSAGGSINFLGLDKFTEKFKFFDIDKSVGKAYWAPQYHDFGWGECPHDQYRVNMQTDLLNPEGAEIYLNEPKDFVSDTGVELKKLGTIGKDGIVTSYLDPGIYTLTVLVDNKIYGSKTFEVTTHALEVMIEEGHIGETKPKPGTEPEEPNKPNEPETDPDYVLYLASLTIYNPNILMDYSSAEETPWYNDREMIYSIELKEGVTKIGTFSFAETTARVVTMKSKVTEIGNSAFAGCTELNSIEFPGTIEEWKQVQIGEGNDRLKQATIYCIDGEVVGEENVVASGNCGEQGDNVKWILDKNNILTIKGKGKMKNYGGGDIPWKRFEIAKVVIEEGVTSIGEYAFAYCFSLTDVMISEDVLSIGGHAFAECSRLERITIPDSVTTIDAMAFYDCSGLIEIKLSKNITAIEDYTFYNCIRLTTITIPKSVVSVGSCAFNRRFDGGLTDVEFEGTKKQWQKIVVDRWMNNPFEGVVIHCTDGDIKWKNGSGWCENSIEVGKTSASGSTLHAVFNGLTEGESYAVIVSKSATDPFAAGNLIYVNQKTADVNGVLDVPFVPVNATEADAAYVVASHREPEKPKYTITIKVGDKVVQTIEATEGETVTIEAQQKLDDGREFQKWNVDTNNVTLKDAASSKTTFKMVGEDVTIHAVYKSNGNGSGDSGTTKPDNPSSSGSSSSSGSASSGSGSTSSKPSSSGSSSSGSSSSSKPSSSGSSSEDVDPGTEAMVVVFALGSVAVAAIAAGVVLMMPVEVSGVAQLGDGNVLANAEVQLMKDGQQVAQTTTDESGHFAMEVKRGEYQLNVITTNPETGEQVVRTTSIKAPAKNTSFVF